eukprot:248953_1
MQLFRALRRRSVSLRHIKRLFVTIPCYPLQCIKYKKPNQYVMSPFNPLTHHNVRSISSPPRPFGSNTVSSNDFYEFENFNDYSQFENANTDSTDRIWAGSAFALCGFGMLYVYNQKALRTIVS